MHFTPDQVRKVSEHADFWPTREKNMGAIKPLKPASNNRMLWFEYIIIILLNTVRTVSITPTPFLIIPCYIPFSPVLPERFGQLRCILKLSSAPANGYKKFNFVSGLRPPGAFKGPELPIFIITVLNGI